MKSSVCTGEKNKNLDDFELEIYFMTIFADFINFFVFFPLFFQTDCSEINQLNASDSSWNATTESSDSTTIPISFDSVQEFDIEEDYTFEPNEDEISSTDNMDFETTTSTTTSSTRSSRRKRHINFPGVNVGDNNAYTMEVMVAVDRKMQEYHGNNIQAYVLTLMSIVSNIYSDPSIGNSINVAVVHIFLLKHDLHESDPNRVGTYSI